MADTIKLFGSNIPKPIVIGGGAAIVIGGIFFYRQNQQKAASQASVDAAGASAIDPATGYPYGSPEDAAALTAQGNYQSPNIGGYGFTGYAGSSGASAFGSGAPGTFTNNAEWAQFVEAYEINNMGADAATVGNAIGKYITGQPLINDNMISIVQSAIAIGGYPPVSGPNGHPPAYITAPAPSPLPQPGKTAGPISGLSVSVKGQTATVKWNAASNASGGYGYKLTQMNHVLVKSGGTTGLSVTFPNLHRGWTYNFGIQALPGGQGNNIHINIK
jgi:hypothetical protein